MTDIANWATSAGGNNTGSSPNYPVEGMAPSAVNDVMRENMAAIARYNLDTTGVLDSTGSSNAYLLAPNQTISAYARGQRFLFEANHTNTGASTLNVSSVGAQSIVTVTGTALAGGEITSGGVYEVVYDGTNFQLTGTLSGAIQISSTSVVDLSNAVAPLVVAPGTGQHLELDGDELQSKSDATTAATLSLNRLGGDVRVGAQSGTGGASFYRNGDVIVQLAGYGLNIFGTSSNGQISLSDVSGESVSLFKVNNSYATLRNQQQGPNLRLEATQDDGTVVTVLDADPGGQTGINHNGVEVVRTRVDGIDLDGDGNNITLALENSGAQYSALSHDIGTALILRNSEPGTPLRLQARNTADNANNTLVEGNPDGGVTLNYIDSARLAVTNAGATLTGTLNATVGLTVGGAAVALASDVRTDEEIQDLAGGMFSGNTETGLTASYQDGDGTIDLALDISGLTGMTVAPAAADGFLYDDGGVMKRMSFNQVALFSNNDSDAHSFADSDVGGIRYFTGTTATWTMGTGVGQDDCYIVVVNSGSGNLTFAGSGVTMNSVDGNLALPPNGTAVLIRESNTVWFVSGPLE